MCFRLIDAKKSQHPVCLLCSVLGVSRAGYYAWKDRPASPRQRRDDELLEQIGVIHGESKATYGWPRVHAELRHRGVRASRKRVARLMRQAGLSGMVRRRKGKTTIRVPGIATAPDLVRRDFAPRAPNRLWVADLTEVATWEGKLYLAVVVDAFSRRCIGWAMAEHMRAELVVEALEMAIWQRRPDTGLIHHSDRGSQPGLKGSLQHRGFGEGTVAGGTGARGTEVLPRGCRRGGSPGGRAVAAIATRASAPAEGSRASVDRWSPVRAVRLPRPGARRGPRPGSASPASCGGGC
jgi:transposase InsO family protein